MAIGIDMYLYASYLLILSTAELITGLTLLSVTIRMLIPSRYVKTVTRASRYIEEKIYSNSSEKYRQVDTSIFIVS